MQVLVHHAAHVVAVGKVEREEALVVVARGARLRGGVGGVEVLRGLALDEHGRRAAPLRIASSASRLALARCLSAVTKAAVGRQPLVPPAVLPGKRGGDEDLVHRRVEADPGEAAREGRARTRRTGAASRGSGNRRPSPARRSGRGRRWAGCPAAAARAKVSSANAQSYLPGRSACGSTADRSAGTRSPSSRTRSKSSFQRW